MSVVFINTPFKGLKLGYTNIAQGFSNGEFAKLNLSDKAGDNPLAVEKNRNLFSSYVGNEVKWLNQNHTNIARAFDEYDGSFCDAIMTDKPNQVCAVLTADCLPILIFDKKLTKVAAVHAGWKGLAQGIVEATLKDFIGLDMVAWFGPCISQTYYEVGEDVFEQFTAQNGSFAQAFIPKGNNKYLFDMKFIAKHILNDNHCVDIVDSKLCTYSNKKFYSYRKDGKTGRQASFIWFE
ncbi:UNVERIFIED_CONTAM: hypothetical protein GTU68_039600 [Idotea baltica]|uniref:peptidoglycan editing factor PgeF n=1 Tax=Francisella sp. Scap27 TaxID=2589986 RepID=UPI0015C1958B|nr:peptidoglycan editing factor PgeF [Francisella sp. Scap27]MCL4122518.1 hypothetical protein [Idotea baltica]QLE78714.1 peptidoglycan editing factor PgeF [Francisella sp. Scap27]